jgi:hypothetical protein
MLERESHRAMARVVTSRHIGRDLLQVGCGFMPLPMLVSLEKSGVKLLNTG